MKTKRGLLIAFIIACGFILFVSAHSTRNDNFIERPIQFEEWMSKPFVDSFEEPIEVEEWMTKPFIIN